MPYNGNQDDFSLSNLPSAYSWPVENNISSQHTIRNDLSSVSPSPRVIANHTFIPTASLAEARRCPYHGHLLLEELYPQCKGDTADSRCRETIEYSGHGPEALAEERSRMRDYGYGLDVMSRWEAEKPSAILGTEDGAMSLAQRECKCATITGYDMVYDAVDEEYAFIF